MIDIRALGSLQLDGLREVGNIGAGHAATALSQLTKRRIVLEAPEIRIVSPEGVAELTGPPGEVVAAVVVQVLGDITGRTAQIFPASTARRLAAILLDRDDMAFPEGFGELEQSALKEIGNILTGAYLNALSDFMGMLLLPSVPYLAIDMTAAVLTSSYLNFDAESDHIFCIDTIFGMDEREDVLRGHFLLGADAASLEVILRTMRLG